MPAGILYVESRIARPEALSEADFGKWYEDTHIPEVLTLPGFPSAARYRSLTSTSPTTSTSAPPNQWLVTYALPDVAYRASPAFTGMMAAGPTADEREKFYKPAFFDIRFYALADEVSGSVAPEEGARVLASVAVAPREGEEGFEAWCEEYVEGVKGVEGFVRARRFEVLQGVRWNEGEPEVPGVPVARWLFVLEFADGAERVEVRAGLETVGARKVVERADVGWWEMSREFAESEWGHVGVEGAEP